MIKKAAAKLINEEKLHLQDVNSEELEISNKCGDLGQAL